MFKKLKYILPLKYQKRLIILIILMFFGMLFEMIGLGILIPIFGIIFDNVELANKYPELVPFLNVLGSPTKTELIVIIFTFLVIFYIIKSVYLIYLGWRQSAFVSELSSELSKDLFQGYLKQPYIFHLQRNPSKLLSNIQIELVQFTLVAQSTIFLAIEFSVVVSIIFVLFISEPFGAIFVTIFLGGLATIFHKVSHNYILSWGKKRQLNSSDINKHLLQGLGGVKDLQVLGRTDFFTNKYNESVDKLSKITTSITTLSIVPRIYLELLAIIGLSGIVIIMIFQGKSLTLLVPILGIFVAAAFRLMPSINRIMASIQNIRYAEPVINLLYDEFSSVNNFESTINKTNNKLKFNHSVEVRKLTFNYPNVSKKALYDISLVINKGESIGIIGPSGSGKSTLVDLLLGILSPLNGNIYVDDLDVQCDLRSWQNQIGYVSQSIYLTDDTLRNNIAFGIPQDQIDDNSVSRALEISQLLDFVNSLPEGLDTMVGDRGVRLSGGQRQRIGIARALYNDPQILIFDEATSALDNETESKFLDSINILHGSKTLIIVAHRLTSVVGCDRLYVVDHGKIVNSGVPSVIIKESKLFSQ